MLSPIGVFKSPRRAAAAGPAPSGRRGAPVTPIALILALGLGLLPSVSPPLAYDAQTPQGVKLILKGGGVDAAAVDRHLREVEAALGYAGTDLSRLYLVVEPWASTPQGTRAILPCWHGGGVPACSGYFMAAGGFYLIGIHLGYAPSGDLRQTALRFEANRFLKFVHRSPDWRCQQYTRLGCFHRYTDLPLGWLPSGAAPPGAPGPAVPGPGVHGGARRLPPVGGMARAPLVGSRPLPGYTYCDDPAGAYPQVLKCARPWRRTPP